MTEVTANVRLYWGKLLAGVCPTPLADKSGDDQFPVLFKLSDGSYFPPRPDGLAWDDAWADGVATAHPEGGDDVLFTASQREISFPDADNPGVRATASLQTRARGAVGGWEKPNGGTDPQGARILYRRESGVVLTVEVRS